MSSCSDRLAKYLDKLGLIVNSAREEVLTISDAQGAVTAAVIGVFSAVVTTTITVVAQRKQQAASEQLLRNGKRRRLIGLLAAFCSEFSGFLHRGSGKTAALVETLIDLNAFVSDFDSLSALETDDFAQELQRFVFLSRTSLFDTIQALETRATFDRDSTREVRNRERERHELYLSTGFRTLLSPLKAIVNYLDMVRENDELDRAAAALDSRYESLARAEGTTVEKVLFSAGLRHVFSDQGNIIDLKNSP